TSSNLAICIITPSLAGRLSAPSRRIAGKQTWLGVNGYCTAHGSADGGSARGRVGARGSASEEGSGMPAEEAQVPTPEMAGTPPSIRKSAPTTYAESSDAR